MTTRRRRLSVRIALALLAAALAGGCDRTESADGGSGEPTRKRPVKDRLASPLQDWVRQPVVDEAEQDLPGLRIVSAAPNVTEICCALGLRPALVGRTRYCTYPPEIASVPSIGALIDVNVESLLALQPDLILVSGDSRSQMERLAPLNLRVETIPDENLEDLFAGIRRVGALANRRRTADGLCARIRADLEAVREAYPRSPSARVLLLTGTLSDPPRPPYVAGPGSFYDDLLKLAGQVNVVPGGQAAYAPLSLEFIVRADPDVIIELDPDGRERRGGDAEARRCWAKVGALRAVTDKRVHVLTGSGHFVLGPRIALTYDALRRAIAGDRDE